MPHRWAMPLLKLGEKRYYLGIFFKVNCSKLKITNYIFNILVYQSLNPKDI